MAQTEQGDRYNMKCLKKGMAQHPHYALMIGLKDEFK
jgi:hypothetical protein